MAGWRNLIGRMEATVVRRPAVEFWIWLLPVLLTVGVGVVMPVYAVVVFWQVSRDTAITLLSLVAAGWCVFGLAMIPRRH